MVVSTEGDRRLDVPISEIGGKGVFAKEVQAAVLDGRADLAVHSAKDLPSVTAPGLVLAAVPERGDARDALVGARLDDLAPGAVVATGSARRRAQLARAAARPHVRRAARQHGHPPRQGRPRRRRDRRGRRRVRAARARRAPEPRCSRPVGVRAAGRPGRARGRVPRGRRRGRRARSPCIEHAPSRRRVDAERAFLAELGGDCDLPAGAHAVLDDDGTLSLDVILADEVGGRVVQLQRSGGDGAELGRAAAIEAARPARGRAGRVTVYLVGAGPG